MTYWQALRTEAVSAAKAIVWIAGLILVSVPGAYLIAHDRFGLAGAWYLLLMAGWVVVGGWQRWRFARSLKTRRRES